jgi:acetyl-CoA carboxylase carboxyltransferase component
MTDRETGPTTDRVADFRARRLQIRQAMGGAEKVERLHAEGRRTVREHIDAFCDPGSFEEVGTFSRSANPADADSTPGDGKIGGHGTFDGHPVTLYGDDITVRRGSSSIVGTRKIERITEQAILAGNPIVHFGQTGGARIPDTLGTEGFVEVGPKRAHSLRRRRVPLCTVIVGDSFGGSSFVSAHSDFVVQVRGTCLAVTSPRVFEVATGEVISFEDLGGVDVHSRITGQIDHHADDDDTAYDLVKSFLSYLPPNAWTPPERVGGGEPSVYEADPELGRLVPENRRRAYDMRTLLRRLVDGGRFLELRPLIGRSLITCFARLDGWPVGIVASQPLQQAGVLGPEACDKATKLIVLCDAFNLPLIFLQDVPGFLVGRQVEHAKILHKAIMFQQALHLAEVPKLTVVLRKAFGLAYYSLAGNDQGADLVCTWPGAEIGFMDPDVGASVLYGTQLQHLEREERLAELRRRADVLRDATDPFGGAGVMKIDEVIDPADTRAVLARYLGRFAGRPFHPGTERPLSAWPTCW